MKHLCIPGLLLAGIAGYGQSVVSQRASMTGSRGVNGKCTIEVNVDSMAEIEIAGDRAELHTLSGTPANWVRFECSDPLPRFPDNFKFKGIAGRGRKELLRDPRTNRGVAVARIEDPKAGRENYTFDIEWSGLGSPAKETFGRLGKDRSEDPEKQRLIDACTNAVRERADRDYGYRNLEFGRVVFGDTPGRGDSVTGRFIFRRARSSEEFEFSCSVDLKDSRVKRVDLRRW